MIAMNINLHIEKLVLEGLNLSPREGVQLQVAVEAELLRLLMTNGLAEGLTTGETLASLPVAPVTATKNNNPTQLGHQIAHSIYGGISK